MLLHDEPVALHLRGIELHREMIVLLVHIHGGLIHGDLRPEPHEAA